MTRQEWDAVVAVLAANWPTNPPPDSSIEKWFGDLEDFPAEQVLVTVEVLAREGRRFPPNGAEIRSRLVDLAADELDWSEAWALVREAGRKFGLGDGPPAAMAWVEERSMPAAIAAKRMGAREVFGYHIDNEPTARAQFRDTYREVLQRKRSGALLAGLPSAGLAQLERADRSSRHQIHKPGTVAREDRVALHHPRKSSAFAAIAGQEPDAA